MAPRLKPIKDEKILSAIPLDEPVLVDLGPIETGAAQEEEVDVHKAKTDDGGEDPGVKALKDRMAEMERANATENARLAKEAEDARRDAAAARAANADTEADLIATSLESAKTEQAAAKDALRTALEAGDYAAAADAQERMSVAAADVREFTRAAQVQTDRKATEAKATKDAADNPQRQQQQFATVEAAIDARTDLTDAERTWLKEHQDAWVDPIRNQELGTAYNRAIKAGHQRGTPAYFAFINDFMGYTQRTDDDAADQGSSFVAAPVSRDSRSASTGRPSTPQRITLTPEQRQLAKDMGLTDVQYARGVQQLDANKKADPEKFARH